VSQLLPSYKSVPHAKTKAQFVQPMLLLRTERLPEGPDWLYQLKLDGYRTIAIKSGGTVHLRSRNTKASTASIRRSYRLSPGCPLKP
jgi:ATP-dependent DNA ligase